MNKTLEPGAIIGILGGGQLGRMLAIAASRLGFKTHIYEPSPNCPASQVSDKTTTAPYDDLQALSAFAISVDVVTYEFENIPTQALDEIENQVQIFPPRNALAISQDRLLEKQFLTGLGLDVAPFANLETNEDLNAAHQIGAPSILKTRRFGYDGKGQVRLHSIDELETAWVSLETTPSVLEGFVDFSKEVSVIAARAQDGQISVFDVGENVHNNGILHSTTVPASLSQDEQEEAVKIATSILNGLEYVGVMGVELFVTSQGLIVNEFAPRVHNSGHWTQNATTSDQFEQHIRAITGWVLGDGSRHSDVEMINLIGDDVLDWRNYANEPLTAVHLYGKSEVKSGRKMGHINRVRKISSC